MTMVCVKCSYCRKPTDTAPDYECPKCGVIYAKAEAALRGGQTASHRQDPPNTDIHIGEIGGGGLTATRVSEIKKTMLLIVIGVAIGGGTIWALVKPSQQPASKQAEQLVVNRPVQPVIKSTAPAVPEISPPSTLRDETLSSTPQQEPTAVLPAEPKVNRISELLKASAIIDNIRILGRDCEWALKVDSPTIMICKDFLGKLVEGGEWTQTGKLIQEILEDKANAEVYLPELRRIQTHMNDVVRYKSFVMARLAVQ